LPEFPETVPDGSWDIVGSTRSKTIYIVLCLQCQKIRQYRTEADDVVDKVQLKIEKSKIYRNLDILDEREVVVGRFGLETGGEERTQREIAKKLGISRSYVSRIEKRALMKLYHELYKQKR
jgi:RNA polymerase sigma factor (sigma-70 family)